MPAVAQFPLQSVLLPGMVLGLNVFEPRYLALLDDVSKEDNRFGVVMITRGSEVGGADQRAEVGTLAEVLRREPAGDNRWLVEANGTERFKVIQWLEDRPYPRAEIEPWTQILGPDGQTALADAALRFRSFLALASELGADVSQLGGEDALNEMEDAGIDGLYQMAVVTPISTYDQYQILSAPSGELAAGAYSDAVDGVLEVLRHRLAGN